MNNTDHTANRYADAQRALHAAVGTLRAGLASLDTRDHAFATSLLQAYDGPRGASPAQAKWLVILAGRTQRPAAPLAQSLAGAGFATLIALFTRASAHLKRPRIDVQVEGRALTLSLAPSHGKNPGYVYVRDGGEYAGKVSPGGVWSPAGDAHPDVSKGVALFAADPAKAAQAHGRLTGNCCFCRLPLTDARSTAAGYGQKCASNYGLAWGGAKSDVSGLFAASA
jgi:hypothetical protein